MSNDLQLDEEKDFSRPVEVSKPSVLVNLVLATGFVKTEEQVKYVLLGITAVCFLIASIISVVFLSGGEPPVNPYQEGQSVLEYPRNNSSSK